MTNLNLPSNSDKAREKRVEQVAQGTTRPPRKSSRIKEAIAGDDVHSVGDHLLFEVVIPATKTLIVDLVVGGIERLMYGGSSFNSTGRRSFGSREPERNNRTPYSRVSTSGAASRVSTPGSSLSRKSRATHDFREVVISTRGEAERILDILQETIDVYNQATVSDLYDACGITSDFPDDRWGWTDIRGAAPERTRDGYILNLPRPISLD